MYIFLALFFLELEMFQTKVAEKIQTHIVCQITLLEIPAVYTIMWKNTLEPGRPQMTI
jgi:hypothetical protein